MNIYSCWYGGVFGYSTRSYRKSWMFVPESGQFDSQIREHLSLGELVFKNKQEKRYEVEFEKDLDDSNDVTYAENQNIFNLQRFSKLMGIA